jgi:hypothetical protein
MMTLTKESYRGWPNCYRLSNGVVDLVATTALGPRIVRFGFVGEENEFVELAGDLGQTGGDVWRACGGHRLWHAPEDPVRTYQPDNQPVELVQKAESVRLIQPTEPGTGIQKEMELAPMEGKARVQVIHRLQNHNLWPVELAPWALSMMNTGGVGLLPLPPRGTHPENLVPNTSLVLWAYTDMTDARWTWGRELIMLRQDPGLATPQKVGLRASLGWAAYARNGHLYVKTFALVPGATYPDLNSSVELFANDELLEVETLGPLVRLEPGAAVSHTETWHLFRDVPQPQTEAEALAALLPIVEELALT